MDSEKVVMVISQYYPLLGGAEGQARRLAAALRDKGMEVFVLTRRLKQVPPYEVIDGVPVYRSIRTVNLPLLFGILYLTSVAWFLYRKRHDYSIIHCHILQEYQTVVALIFKLLFNKKVIAKMSSSGLTSDIALMKKTLAGKATLCLLKKADRIISLCSRSTQELLNEGIPADRVSQIANGVDTGVFTLNARNRRHQKVITFIGRLDRFKGVEWLLEAFRGLIRERPDVQLRIIGDGPDAIKFKRQAAIFEIPSKIIFRGRRENVVEEFSETDVFVLPSLSEGMSNVLLEAMSCGLPVVATTVGGTPDVICNRVNGILVRPGDTEALKEALSEVLGNESLANSLGKAARKTVESRYQLAHTAACYQQLYRQLLSRPVERTRAVLY